MDSSIRNFSIYHVEFNANGRCMPMCNVDPRLRLPKLKQLIIKFFTFEVLTKDCKIWIQNQIGYL